MNSPFDHIRSRPESTNMHSDSWLSKTNIQLFFRYYLSKNSDVITQNEKIYYYNYKQIDKLVCYKILKKPVCFFCTSVQTANNKYHYLTLNLLETNVMTLDGLLCFHFFAIMKIKSALILFTFFSQSYYWNL